FVYFAEDSQHDRDLWVSASDFARPRQLTHINPQFGRYHMGAARLVTWLSDDGASLQGVLLLPADYREGKRYPLITVVYGSGNLSSGFNRFGSWGSGAINMQLFATRGYAVF